jgi:hypothetical protein
MPFHRLVLAVWHMLISGMLVWMITRNREGELHWIWVPVVLSPVLVLGATTAPIPYRRRAVLYWLLAVFTIPTALGGLTSLIGPTYIVSVILLIWAARRENPASEIVQM